MNAAELALVSVPVPGDLDVPDYEAQSAAYMRGLGIPLDSYAMSGTQILDINDEPLITISTDPNAI